MHELAFHVGPALQSPWFFHFHTEEPSFHMEMLCLFTHVPCGWVPGEFLRGLGLQLEEAAVSWSPGA